MSTFRSRATWGAVAAAGTLAGSLAGTVVVRRRRVRAVGEPAGRLVDIGGRRLHALVGGTPSGLPAVVFESGLGYPVETWTYLQRALSADTLTVSYERAGVCWSDPGPRPRSLDRLAGDLRALLDALDVPGPVVVVGHSFGGLVAHRFALDHPDRTAGVVFLDALHPQELRRSSRQRRVMAWTEQNLQLSALHCTVGMSRKHVRAQFTELPDDVAERARARIADPGTWRAALAELVHWKGSDLRQTDPGRFAPHVRVAVVGSGDSVRSDVVRKRLQQELLGLSGHSFAVLAREVGHADLVFEPSGVAVAVRAVRTVLREVAGTAGSGEAGGVPAAGTGGRDAT